MGSIQYIAHNHIDQQKWDACIGQSSQGLVYAYSWYLNIMSPCWHALVLGDYEAVMPLTGRQKWGISYLYQPAFCAELGIFSKASVSEELILDFLENIPARYQYIDICLNRNNIFQLANYPFKLRRNYILSLDSSYELLSYHYSENHTRNIKKAKKNGLLFDMGNDINKAIELSRVQPKNVSSYLNHEWISFEQLFHVGLSRQAAACAYVSDTHGNLLSAAIFFYSHHTWFYMAAGTTKEGRNLGASHFLIDQFIHQHAGTHVYLDFEGSDVDSVALFYRGFGSVNKPYPSLLVNRLPFWLRWLKK